MVYNGYIKKGAGYTEPVRLSGADAVAKFVLKDTRDKVITDENDNMILDTCGGNIKYVNPMYMQLRAAIIAKQSE